MEEIAFLDKTGGYGKHWISGRTKEIKRKG